MKAFLHSAARIAAGVLIGVFIVLSLIYMFQEKLIFFPQPLSRAEADTIAKMYPHAESIAIRTADNVTVRGWFVKNSKLLPLP